MTMEVTTSEVVGTATIQIPVTREMLSNILCCAFEGGSNYWIGGAKYTQGKQSNEPLNEEFYAPKGFVIELKDAEDGKWFAKKAEEYNYRPLTEESLIQGITLYFSKDRGQYAWKWDDDCSMDADSADQVVQLAVFGEVVFG